MVTPIDESTTSRAEAIPAGRLRWLATARLIVLAGALVLSFVVARLSPDVALMPLVITLVALAILSLAILWYLRPARDAGEVQQPAADTRQNLVALQVVADIVGLTLVIHFSGGAENPFYPLYAFPIIVAAVLLGRFAALGAAALATILYTSTVVTEWMRLLPHYHVLPAALGLAETGVYVLAQCVAVAVTAFLAAEGTSTLVGMLHTRTPRPGAEPSPGRGARRGDAQPERATASSQRRTPAQSGAPRRGVCRIANRVRQDADPLEPHERTKRAVAGRKCRVQVASGGTGAGQRATPRGPGPNRDAQHAYDRT